MTKVMLSAEAFQSETESLLPAELGAYIRLITYLATHSNLPNDDAELAEIGGLDRGTWSMMSGCVMSLIQHNMGSHVTFEKGEEYQSDWPKDFRQQFWQMYPRKIGKAATIKKLEIIRRDKKATWRQIVEGVQRYIKNKPAEIDFCHPATWLNQGRWEDEFDAAPHVTIRGNIHYPKQWAI